MYSCIFKYFMQDYVHKYPYLNDHKFLYFFLLNVFVNVNVITDYYVNVKYNIKLQNIVVDCYVTFHRIGFRDQIE